MARSRTAWSLLVLASCASMRASSFPEPAAPHATAPALHGQQDSATLPVGVSPVRGPREALVTIVEFGDFECPFCGLAEPTLRRLRERFGAELRVVWKNAPLSFHARALPAAEAGLEVQSQLGDEAFWRFHDALLDHSAQLTDEGLEQLAADLGANMTHFRAAMASHQHIDSIEVDSGLAEHAGATGTPYFLINGTPVSGAKPYELFATIVERVLARARQIQPPERAYAAMTASPVPSPEPAEAPRGRAADARYTVRDAPRGSPSRGPADAPVVVQMFADFECPYCAAVQPAIDALLAHHPTAVRLVWRDYPLPMHPHAMLAAEAAREAFAQGGSAGFWRMHDALLAHQGALGRADLERYARESGLDVARFRAALDAHTHRDAVQADADAADATGADIGTPAFFVNGRLIEGAADVSEFERAVHDALAEHR